LGTNGSEHQADQPSIGFPPVAESDARILVLGSLPGQRSLAAAEYYAHPQNAFWKIMQELVGARGSYERRCETLKICGIALWDVLAESVRPGSMDADIRMDASRPNDFERLFRNCPEIRRVCFNGKKAAAMYERLVGRDKYPMHYMTLPSTSPAYASMHFAEKLSIWRDALQLK
jgi:TDG/mug DNA glycosylase family protein